MENNKEKQLTEEELKKVSGGAEAVWPLVCGEGKTRENGRTSGTDKEEPEKVALFIPIPPI